MKTAQEIAFTRLLKIMDELREQCPWDKKQTLESLRHLTIEETYELSDAIIENDMPELKKELGDILLHIVFYAKIATEKNEFTITDVINSLCDKMITRHPHIYADVKVENAEQVKQNWEKIKIGTEGNKSVLGGVPKGLPAMIKAERIQEKVRGVGFDWENTEQVWQKVEEEMGELKAEIVSKKSAEKTEEEFGDLLFALINYSRFLNISPETALEKANKKFIRRFEFIENKIKEQGKSITDSNLTEMDGFWNEAKKQGL
ncbi:MAG TPA: nucleoside triphosphate pyrophosphohydrolase [Bacteroidia bacterium]|jgi:XTP/dITP diphosphohydrolase|nr:nucleoside triphosphate pyrophosphohydrolase [Bacteroidia bacterium]